MQERGPWVGPRSESGAPLGDLLTRLTITRSLYDFRILNTMTLRGEEAKHAEDQSCVFCQARLQPGSISARPSHRELPGLKFTAHSCGEGQEPRCLAQALYVQVGSSVYSSSLLPKDSAFWNLLGTHQPRLQEQACQSTVPGLRMCVRTRPYKLW
ncbi:hypothetical protein NDU88_001442 [Pleurodeles waltl]|uniref:Uncharacterized protein n=1 Tax=Pleurodeles waltl TaxID=8319 RepID=A0AAV7TIL0_PLEWA|nr:hypothetical protein NDU88_001442 [Pleurodeles waltl]